MKCFFNKTIIYNLSTKKSLYFIFEIKALPYFEPKVIKFLLVFNLHALFFKYLHLLDCRKNLFVDVQPYKHFRITNNVALFHIISSQV